MKSPAIGRVVGWLVALICLASSAAVLAQRPAPTSSNDWNVRVLNALLANTPAEAATIEVGDMILPRAFVEAARDRAAGRPSGATPDSAFAGSVALWPGGVVYYDFAGDITPPHQQAFIDAARDWSTFANVTFIRRTNQANYVYVQNFSINGGQSAVGMMGGPQNFFIGPNAWNRGTLNHEIGHVLGLVHEHQRFDRDGFVLINTANIIPGQEANFVVLTDSDNQSSYDFDSVMHYARNQAAIDPTTQNTIVPQPAYLSNLNTMGNHFDRPLSPLDRQKMAVKYGAGPTQGSVVTNTQDSGPGSLRAAIYYAVDHPGTTITFNIPNTDPGFANSVYTVTPSDVMTALGAGTIIDGTTQPASNPSGPSVNLSGLQAQAGALNIAGLRLTASNCTVRGLLLNNFTTHGIEITGSGATGNTISGCYIGTTANGAASSGNASAGISLNSGASSNTIGGTTVAARNFLSGNTLQGVLITDPGTNNNLVIGNYIGLNSAGTAAVANADSGVGIFNGAQSNFIGGLTVASRNVISGNTKQGVAISDSGTNNNQVIGNYVGTDPSGAVAIPNVNGGVNVVSGAQSNTIGGVTAGAGNLISGNSADGVFVGFTGTANNIVQGNMIGTNPAGTVALPNTQNGVNLYAGAQATLVGGTVAGAGNLISGNTADGVFVGFAGSNSNTIQGNLIGTSVTGSAALGNGGSGVDLYSGAQSNLVGGTSAAAANVISGNGNAGVFVGYVGTDNNTIQGNLIGLNRAGAAAVSNGTGVAIFLGPKSNTVGGSARGAGNVISGNLGDGVFVGSTTTDVTMNNTVAGNLIGLDLTGLNVVANGSNGVDLYGSAQSNTIGGLAGGRNFIAGSQVGVIFNGQSGLLTSSNVVQGNTIGLNAAGNSAPNVYHGIGFYGGAANNLVGGSAIGASNIVAGNGSDGILTVGDTTVANTFQRNSIFRNAAYGIQLSASTIPQAAPTLSSAQAAIGTTIAGTLASTASSSFRLEFFATPAGDTSFTAGRYFLGETTANTNSGGSANFNLTLGARIPAGYIVTATATNAAGTTSQFSNPATVQPPASTLGDGIPDAWKTLYGFSVSDPTVAGKDVDGTGMTNLQKFKAGLNPIDAHSFLRVTGAARSGNGFTVTFPSVSGIVYKVERGVDLTTGSWTLVADQILGTGSPVSVTDPGGGALAQGFFRVSVQP